jgi:hypothetical protein
MIKIWDLEVIKKIKINKRSKLLIIECIKIKEEMKMMMEW